MQYLAPRIALGTNIWLGYCDGGQVLAPAPLPGQNFPRGHSSQSGIPPTKEFSKVPSGHFPEGISMQSFPESSIMYSGTCPVPDLQKMKLEEQYPFALATGHSLQV
jgi:hypothetical protein